MPEETAVEHRRIRAFRYWTEGMESMESREVEGYHFSAKSFFVEVKVSERMVSCGGEEGAKRRV